MKNQLSARSPFWQIVFMLHAFAFLIALSLASYVTQEGIPVDGSYTIGSYTVNFPAYTSVIVLSFMLFAVWGTISARNYNKGALGKKVSIWDVYPAELITDDERSAQVSSNATRAVYLYHNIAWPIVAIAIVLAQSIPLTLVFIAAALLGHYLVYWYNIRSLLSEG